MYVCNDITEDLYKEVHMQWCQLTIYICKYRIYVHMCVRTYVRCSVSASSDSQDVHQLVD